MGHAGHSCGTLLWDTVAGHSCGTLIRDTLVGNSCAFGLLTLSIVFQLRIVGHSCGTLL